MSKKYVPSGYQIIDLTTKNTPIDEASYTLTDDELFGEDGRIMYEYLHKIFVTKEITKPLSLCYLDGSNNKIFVIPLIKVETTKIVLTITIEGVVCVMNYDDENQKITYAVL